MKTLPPAPNPGDRISATLMREILRAIRERTPLAGHGVRVTSGPNGTVINADAPRAASSAPTPSCWYVKSETSSGTTVHRLGNQYYLAGATLKKLALATTLESFAEENKPFVALKVPAVTGTNETPALAGYETEAALIAATEDLAYAVRPLYKMRIDEGEDADGETTYSYGGIEIDLRNMPAIQIAEVIA